MLNFDLLPNGILFKFNPLHYDTFIKCGRDTYEDNYGEKTSINIDTVVFPINLIYVVSAEPYMKGVLFVSSSATDTYNYLCKNPDAKYVTYWVNEVEILTELKDIFFDRCA